MNRILHLAAVLLVAPALIGFAGCSKNGAIHDAARNGDLATVKALLQAHPDLISSKDTNGITLLDIAAYKRVFGNSRQDKVAERDGMEKLRFLILG